MVRVKIKIIYKNKEVMGSAIVNTGYETDENELLIPVGLAKKLNIWPELPANTIVDEYFTSGGRTKVYFVKDKATVCLFVNDKILSKTQTYLVISEIEEEVLISDTLAEELNIAIENTKKGIWKIRGENKLYVSAEPEVWK